MTKKTTTRPKADATLTEEQYRQALEGAELTPEQVWEGEHGVMLRGPYFRLQLTDDGKVRHARRYYRGYYEEPPGSGIRKHFEARSKSLGLAEARRIDANLGAGLRAKQAENRFRPVTELIDAYLDPANHLHQWSSPRSQMAPASFLNTWVRPVIGHLPCVEWDTAGSDRILEQMDKCGLKLSYRDQGYTYLTALANFGRMRKHGYLAANADPLEEVARPGSPDSRFVARETLPGFDLVDALGDNLGDLVAARWVGRVKQPDAARLERAEYERFRWRMFPRFMAGSGARPNEALALRTGNVDLSNRAAGLAVDIHVQAVRGSSTQTAPPKHGSERTTYMSDEYWDDMQKLVRWTEQLFGPNALLWSRMYDPTKMLDDSTLFSHYFAPAAELTDGFSYEDAPQWNVEEEIGTDNAGRKVLVTVPLIGKDGQQQTRRVWNATWRHLRHLYGTTALAPVATGGWGQDIGDVSAWMGHRSPETTWTYYIGHRQGAGARMAAATAATVSAPVARTPATPAMRASRSHLRVVG